MDKTKMNDVAINIAEMPVGTPCYSPLCGRANLQAVKKHRWHLREEAAYEILVMDRSNCLWSFDRYGRYTRSGECLLFKNPQKEEWSEKYVSRPAE